MTGGVQHRKVQTCAACRRQFYWAPAAGLCPYCDLSNRSRQGPYSGGELCRGECCRD